MAKQAELAISPREITGKATKKLRRAGIIPANIFGHGEDPQAVQIEAQAFDELRRLHKATGVVSLKTAGVNKTQTALIRHVQRDPRTGKILHINFFRVNVLDRLTSRVPLHFEGSAPGVKIEGGTLLHLLEALEVECAAGDLADAIEVDISTLEHVDELILAKNVKLPEGYTLVTDPEEAVVKIAPPRIDATTEGTDAASGSAASETPAEKTEG